MKKNKYKGLKENIERFRNDLLDEKTRLLFSIAYKQGYDRALTLHSVVGQSEQLSRCKCGEVVKVECSDCLKKNIIWKTQVDTSTEIRH